MNTCKLSRIAAFVVACVGAFLADLSCTSEFSVSAPLFSRESGFLTEPFDLTLSFDPAYTAYYTLDGSDPDPAHVDAADIVDPAGYSYTERTYVYTAPIHVYDRSSDPNGISMIPTSNIPDAYDDSAAWYGADWVAPEGLVPKAFSIKVQLHKDGVAVSPVESRFWVALPGNLAGLPVINLTSDASNLFDYYKGILVPGYGYDNNLPLSTFGEIAYGNYSYSGPYYERPIVMGFLDADGLPAFTFSGGMRIGGQARGQPNHAMDFYLRSEYGQSWLDYPVTGTDVDEYKRFKLRNGGSNWNNVFFSDSWGQELLSESGLDIQRYRSTAVFLDGEFWGVFDLRDVYDENYLRTKYGFDAKIEQNLDYFNNTKYDLGDSKQYEILLQTARDASENGTKAVSDVDFATIDSLMDTDNFARYQASITVLGSQVYPNNHNDKRWRTRSVIPEITVGDGRWRWMVIDCDGAMFVDNDVFSNPWGPIKYLKLTPTFIHKYLLSIQAYLNTTLESGFVLDYYSRKVTESRTWMMEQRRRWGYLDVSKFESDWAEVSKRATTAASRIRADCEMRFATESVPVTFDRSGEGLVAVDWVKLGSTSKLLGELTFPWSGEYFTGVPVPVTATSATGYRFDHWSASEQISVADATSSATTVTPSSGGGTLTAIFVRE